MTLCEEAEQIAIEHWLWINRQGLNRNHSSIYEMLGLEAPWDFRGSDGIIETMAQIWMMELACGRDA